MTDRTFQTTLVIRGENRDAVRSVELTRKQLEKLTGAQQKNASITDRMRAAFSRANKEVKKSTTGFGELRGLIATIGVGKLVTETIRAADAYTSMQGQLRLVTGSQKELNEVYQEALQISNDTGIATESTVNLYARLARSTEELNLGQDKLLAITRAVNQSFVVSNATAEEAASVSLQLAQGLASGALAGDELKSVMEGNAYLTGLLTDALGINRGELKEWGKEGRLTAEVVSEALLGMTDRVEQDFEQMPVTLNRLWQAITNDINDSLGNIETDELTSALEDLRQQLSSPEFKRAISDISSGLLRVVTTGTKVATTVTGLAKFLGEEFARKVGGIALDDIPALEGALLDAEQQMQRLQEGTVGSSKALDAASAKVEEYRAKLALARSLQKDFADTTDEVNEGVEEEAKQFGILSEIVVQGKRKKETYKDETNKVVRALQEQRDALDRSAREQFIYNEIASAGAVISAENEQRIRGVAGALYDEIAAREAAAKAAEDQAKASAEAAEQTQKDWEEARATLSDFFFEIAASGENAFDTILQGFKGLLVKMIAEAAANQVIIGVGAAAGRSGLGGIAQAANGFAGGGSPLGGLVNIVGSGSLSNAASIVGGLFGGGGGGGGLAPVSIGASTGIEGLSYATPFDGGAGLPGATPSFGSLAGSAVAGFAGSYVGGEVFGETSGIGSTLGGAVGSIYGPVGAAIGSFIGTGLEKGLGKVFGFGQNNGNNQGFTEFNFATGQRGSDGVGNSFNPENVEASAALTDALQAFSQAIGGSNFSGRIEVGNRSGISFIGQPGGEFGQDREGALAFGFRQIIREATNLNDELKPLIENFEGTGEEIAAFAVSMQGLFEGSQINTVTNAITNFTREQPTLWEAYNNQIALVKQLQEEFDGSAQASLALNEVMNLNKNTAYELATALQASGAQLGDLAESQASYFRQSVLTADELREQRIAERDSLRANIFSDSDPQAVVEAQSRILQLNRLIFDSLDEEQRRARSETFAAIATSTTAEVQEFLNNEVQALEQQQQDLNRENAEIQRELIEQQRATASIYSDAVAQFGNWVGQLTQINPNLIAQPSEFLT